MDYRLPAVTAEKDEDVKYPTFAQIGFVLRDKAPLPMRMMYFPVDRINAEKFAQIPTQTFDTIKEAKEWFYSIIDAKPKSERDKLEEYRLGLWGTSCLETEGAIENQQELGRRMAQASRDIGKPSNVTTAITYDNIKKLYWNLTGREGTMIGGDKCHLCDSEVLFTGVEKTIVKKGVNVINHRVYACGTSLYSTWREDSGTGEFKNERRHIHVGSDCISVD